MNSLSDTKLSILRNGINSNNDYWYITKQELNFSNLCRIGEILSRWNPDGAENYENFFNRVKTTDEFRNYIGGTAHRATINLVPYGLKYDAKGYMPGDLTPVFYKIRQITNGNYGDTSLYQDIIDDQLEKIIVNTTSITIYPMMFTFKVILTLGDATGEYHVTKDEFKTFVATAHRWSEFLTSVESILRYRSDAEYRRSVNNTAGKRVANDTRYNIVIANHSLIRVDDNLISIPRENINDVRIKLAKYELSNPVDIDTDSAYSRLTSNTVFSPKQTIFFGAPGVGKSHYLKSRCPNEDDVVRITFHPETDYSSFVGCYKPFMRDDAPGEITYGFQPQAFTEAYVEAWKSFVGKTERRELYLLIEEINRGNCAQIFGDIFQMLDRNDDGFSDYTVRPDKDLENYLKGVFADIRDELNAIIPGLGDGSKLCLPPNLNIYATMNTSDQSLFPIDSAFKRRWDWEYMPINIAPQSAGETVTRYIVTDKYRYDWGMFLDRVNHRIHQITQSEDKQLGFWFVRLKGNDTSIPASVFVSKVLFYLWNDIYKDYTEDATSIFYFADDGNPKSNDKKRRTFKDFTPAFQEIDNNLLDAFLRNLDMTAQPAERQEPAGDFTGQDENSN